MQASPRAVVAVPDPAGFLSAMAIPSVLWPSNFVFTNPPLDFTGEVAGLVSFPPGLPIVRFDGFCRRLGSLSRLGWQVDVNRVSSIYLNVEELRAMPFVWRCFPPSRAFCQHAQNVVSFC